MNTYYGRYKSTDTMIHGCVKELVSKPRSELTFPSTVSYFCSLCNKTHSFRYSGAQIVNTPQQIKRFNEYCTSHYIEQDVEIP